MIKVAGQLDTGHYLSLSITHHLVLPPPTHLPTYPPPSPSHNIYKKYSAGWMIFGILSLTACRQSWFVNEKSSDWSVKMSLLSRSKCSKLLAIFAPSGRFYKLNTQHWRFVAWHSSTPLRKIWVSRLQREENISSKWDKMAGCCFVEKQSPIISVSNEQKAPPALISWPSYRPTTKNKTFQFRS